MVVFDVETNETVSLGVGHRLPAGGGVQLQMKPILHWHNKALIC